ncbi:MAG: SagB/ThcOx family dehydrogenase, partial [Deltaproteobacteria bacterium]|nr:SagB/ThcOx family dehydrogenase [Deltaproteobacteria bacterium]
MIIMQAVIDYHERTKHLPQRYARSPGSLDWANEPDPFRRYEGAPLFPLPLLAKDPDNDYRDLYERSRNRPQPFSFKNIAAFLELSLGLSAWKSYRETSWALRMNPSSGNLHPTEAHLILPPHPETDERGGIYHYHAYSHSLEQRAAFGGRFWSAVREHFKTDGFLVGLSSIYWRESWKYGERAFRYCQHDLGHALGCLSFSGNLLGWKVTCLQVPSDEEVSTLLGFPQVKWHRFEEEHPGPLLFVHPHSIPAVPRSIPPELVEAFRSLSFVGEPKRLSPSHQDWAVIDQAATATEKPRTPEVPTRYLKEEFPEKEAPS